LEKEIRRKINPTLGWKNKTGRNLLGNQGLEKSSKPERAEGKKRKPNEIRVINPTLGWKKKSAGK